MWRHAAIALSTFSMLAFAGSTRAGSDGAPFDWAETYMGVFAGAGRTDSRIVDVDGFANWGNSGSAVDYDDSGFVGGALIGKKFAIGGVPLRIELDGTLGGLSAASNRLDPEGLDETVKSEFRWIATARAGIERSIGIATVFASGGIAAARIDNSVTDIDFGPNKPTQMDPDDSFRDGSTEIGWVIGLSVEAPLADAWTLRIEGSYLDFGRSTHYVNRSADGPLRTGNAQTAVSVQYRKQPRHLALGDHVPVSVGVPFSLSEAGTLAGGACGRCHALVGS